jgi:hypothetical protein
MCAALSAGASLTPSPVIATTSPLALSAWTMRSFCSGTARAKMHVVNHPRYNKNGAEHVRRLWLSLGY